MVDSLDSLDYDILMYHLSPQVPQNMFHQPCANANTSEPSLLHPATPEDQPQFVHHAMVNPAVLVPDGASVAGVTLQ